MTRIIVIFSFLFISLTAWSAQDNNRLSSIGIEISNTQASLARDKGKLSKLNTKLATTQEALVKSEQAFSVASEAARVASDDDFISYKKATLAARLYNRHLEKIERLDENIDSIKKKITSQQEKITKLEKERKLTIAGINKKRIEEVAAKKAVTAAAKAKIQQAKTQPAKKPKVIQTPKAIAATPIKETKPATWPNLSTTSTQDIAFAKKQLMELSTRKSQGKIKLGLIKSVIITSRLSFGKKNMVYLGDNLFSLTENLKAGQQNFKAFNQDHWYTISPADNNMPHRIIVDTTSLSKPVMHVFKESLIQ